jgi:hypothetical protein
MLKKLLFAVTLLGIPLFAQTKIAPDCVINFTFTAATQHTDNTLTCGAQLTNNTGIVDWTIVYTSTGFSAVSLVVQSAPDSGGTPGTWVTFAGTVCSSVNCPGSSGINPNTATTSAFTRLEGYFPWNRVLLASATGTGQITGKLYGCLQPGCSSSSASAGGGGTVTSVSFTGGLISVATPTTTPALTVAGTSGGIPFFNSSGSWASSGALAVNTLIKGGGAGAAPSNSSVTDNGTSVSTGEPLAALTLSTGTSPPACVAGTAGAWCASQGTAATNVSGAAIIYPDSTVNEYVAKLNGTDLKGVMIRSQPSPISLTGQVAAITTATLCAAAAGACNTAGMYRAAFYLDSTVVCAVAGPAVVSVTITFTDEIGTKSAQTVPLDVNGGLTLLGSLALGTTTGNAFGSTAFWSTGVNPIQYATGYNACTTGTGTYSIRGSVERLF